MRRMHFSSTRRNDSYHLQHTREWSWNWTVIIGVSRYLQAVFRLVNPLVAHTSAMLVLYSKFAWKWQISALFSFILPPCINRRLKRDPGMWKVCQETILQGIQSCSCILHAKSVPLYPHKWMKHAQPLSATSYVHICTNAAGSAMISIMATSVSTSTGFTP